MILSAKNICKTFDSPTPVTVLNGVNLEINEGEAIAITAKSGAGKSTLLHILGTLEKPTSGELTICGKSSQDASLPLLRNAHIGFIFQSCHLLEEETLLANVLMPAKIARRPTHPGSAAYEHALSLLEAVGLSSRAHFLAKVLSGGEKQRGALARALCNDPKIIMADEPSGNLDSSMSQEIHELLISLTRSKNKALIVVTHDPELSSLCDHTYTLKNGILTS